MKSCVRLVYYRHSSNGTYHISLRDFHYLCGRKRYIYIYIFFIREILIVMSHFSSTRHIPKRKFIFLWDFRQLPLKNFPSHHTHTHTHTTLLYRCNKNLSSNKKKIDKVGQSCSCIQLGVDLRDIFFEVVRASVNSQRFVQSVHKSIYLRKC